MASLVPASNDPLGQIPQWKRVLYYIQLQAPKPIRVECNAYIQQRPPYYGREFHGAISRVEADHLLSDDGCYLVRESQRSPGCYTLAIRFNNYTKNYKLYFDPNKKQHYVGDKMFDTLDDLVADGLICFYVNLKAQDYITSMADDESIYEESPYVRYRQEMMRKTRIAPRSPQRQATQELSLQRAGPTPVLPPRSISSVSQIPHHTATRNNQPSQPPVPDSLPPSNRSSVSSEVPDGCKKAISSAKLADDWMNIMKQEKTHNFKTTTFKSLGSCWCDFCLHFMWGLIAQGVECQDCGFRAHKKCSERVPNDCMPSMKKLKRMFGLDLTTLLKATNKSIPYLVEKCVEEIERRGLHHEGLYRAPGFHDDIEEIKSRFDIDGDADITEQKYGDINTVTSVLKLFLRLLPVPLITFEVYPSLSKVVEHHSQRTGTTPGAPLQKDLEIDLKNILAQLPSAHYQTLKYLMGHLNRVKAQAERNKMRAENIAIVFAPTIIQSHDPMVVFGRSEQKILEIMIVHYIQVFER